MMWLLIRLIFIASFYWRLSLGQGWTYPQYSNALSKGSSCKLKLGEGICKRIEECQPYIENKIAYTDLTRCSFMRGEEITCCPIYLQVRWEDRTVEPPRSWQTTTRVTRRRPEGSVCHLTSRIGICTRITQCEALRIGAVDYSELTRCSFIGNDEVVCCPQTRLPRPSVNNRLSVARQRLRASKIACDAFKLKSSSRRLTPNILDGVPASPGEYPHVGAMLYLSEKSGTKYEIRCGASLIAERFALTAAHCVERTWPDLVRFGSVEWQSSDAVYRYDAKVKNVILHEDYVFYLSYHDIAVIEFTEDVAFNTLVYPACLHSTNDDLSSHIGLKVAGWGSTDASYNSKSFNLLSTDLHTVDLESCNETLSEIGYSRQLNSGLHAGQCCAIDSSGYSNKDSCYGDSGGPLMKDIDEKIWELVGIISIGFECGAKRPSIYTRVSYYLDWIERKVWSKMI